MELRALRYFVELVRRESFTAAADTLCVTQSAVSKMVQSLEEEMGTALLVRDSGARKRRVVLTDAGHLVQARAQEMLALATALRADLESLGTLERGELTIGIPPLGAKLMAPFIAAFHARWPGIELKSIESGSHAIGEALRADALQLGVFLAPVEEDLDFIPICDYRLQLLASRTSRWNDRKRKAVALAELASESFLLYDETFRLNEVIDRACRKAGFSPRIACRSSQWDLISTLADKGTGVALLPEPYCTDADATRFVSMPLIEPEIRWSLVLAWRRSAHLSRAARAWIDMTRGV
ncbi:LysR substrate-binding domain-containing protein [Dyella choica]|uniref:LysR family transcriptional regulator n=1 Tax=Dyella choica TaxID=1927959 RepID=A0A432M800_9GAMM|nr:LysR substrate-binding domain-containing protein [Dyella choica]RUL77637.1 LysR family transcriptional regulator [Dyella choica]